MAVPVHCGPMRVRLGTVRRCYTLQPSSASQGVEGARWGQLHGRDAAHRDRHSVVAPAFQTTTSNPALRFANFDAGVERRGGGSMGIEREMTVDGAVAKTGMLVTLAAAAASYVWWQAFTQGAFRSVLGMLPGVSIAALAVSFITCFRPQISPYTAPVFAVMKGAVLGGISVYGEMFYPGIMIQTVALTFGTLGALLAGYVSGFIRVTRSFSETVVLATGGFAVGMLLLWALSHFRIVSPMLLSSGPMALGIGLFSCLLAASNLLLDFSHIERCAWQSMPRWMEWYSAFSLLITLVWMYQSILRVLMLTRSSNER